MLQELPWPKQEDIGEIIFGLERIHHFLHHLGNPHHNFPRVIHVAGTNGKGSTAAFLRNILTAAGERCHAYLSPHLHGFNERILLYNKPISDEKLLEYSQFCGDVARKNSLLPAHFEALTALAFYAFSQNPADFIIIEVGLGGRLDATNIIITPTCSVITPIGMDHTEFLGNTIQDIAREKAGIIRRDAPCVVSKQKPEALSIIQKEAAHKGATTFCCNLEWVLNDNVFSSTRYTPREFTIPFPPLPLPGKHQLDNLATTIAALTFGCGIFVTPAILQEALQKMVWSGRLQRLNPGILTERLSQFTELWLDVAHNVAGAEALAQWITEEKSQADIILVVQLTRNRSYRDFLAPLLETQQIKRVYAIALNNETVESIQPTQSNAPTNNVEYFAVDTFNEVIAMLKTTSLKDKPQHLLFCGSHTLVATSEAFNG
jgi:dihydrofolate synthase / folylpolyglutamate synthase